MYNLIQIQDAIKGLPIQDVMKYARGSNPEVPAYLALTELNRRKQLQDTAVSFYGEPQTVREQIESSLTGAPQGQVNPSAAPQMANPTAPPQLQTLTAPPPKPEMPQMPPQMNPTQAPPMPQMRRGGLASLPVNMFKRSNYAGGGIVAFNGGGSAFTEDIQRLRDYANEPGINEYIIDKIRGAAQGIKTYFTEPRKVTTAPPTTTEQAEIQDMEGSKAKEPTKPNQQASATSSGQITKREPASPTFGQQVTVTQPKIPELSDEQLFERRRKLQELAGVSQDPYADIKKRYSDIEAKRKTEEAEDPKNALRAMLRGYAQASATDPFGVQLAAGSEKMAVFDKETAALRDKQSTTMADLQLNMAKEEDARKRGDVTAVEAARVAQKKDKMDLAKLEIDIMNAQSSRISATRPAAEIQMIERVMRDKNMTFTEAAEYLQGVKGMNALRTAADKEWNESLSLRMEWEKKGGYPAYMASKGLSVSGQSAGVTPPAVGTIKDGFRFKGGNPADKNNWEKV
jgi:hypothetical protein